MPMSKIRWGWRRYLRRLYKRTWMLHTVNKCVNKDKYWEIRCGNLPFLDAL